jgi:hypothetical protein
MSTFAGALGRGLAGYAANRERAMAREEELAQQQRAEARQAMLDERQRVQMEAQAEAMREQRERQAMLDDRMREQDRNTAIDSGLRDTEPTRMMGTLMSGAANIGVGGTGASLGALRSFGNVNTDAASGPQYSVGGKAMSRAARSLEQQDADRTAAEATARRTQDREWQVTDRDQIEKRADARAAADRASRREPGVNMQVIQTADGPMAFNPRTGETKPIMANGKPVQAAVGGMPKMTEGQRRVGGLVEMAEAERKKMEELGTPGMFDRVMAKVPFGLGEPLMSNKGQQYLSAAEAFTRPYLYALSGANANDGEVRSTARQSVPGIFTRRDTDADMKARRARQVDGMRTIAGQSGDVSRDESPQAAKFRAGARAEGYSDEQIDAELRRMGIIR